MSDEKNKNILAIRNTLSSSDNSFTVESNDEAKNGFLYRWHGDLINLTISKKDTDYDIIADQYKSIGSAASKWTFVSKPNHYPTDYWYTDANNLPKQLYFGGVPLRLCYAIDKDTEGESYDTNKDYYFALLLDENEIPDHSVTSHDNLLKGSSPDFDENDIVAINPDAIACYYIENKNKTYLTASEWGYEKLIDNSYPDISDNLYVLKDQVNYIYNLTEPYYKRFTTGLGEGLFLRDRTDYNYYPQFVTYQRDVNHICWYIDQFIPPFQPTSGKDIFLANRTCYKDIKDPNVDKSVKVIGEYTVIPQKDGNSRKKIKNYTFIYNPYDEEAYFEDIYFNDWQEKFDARGKITTITKWWKPKNTDVTFASAPTSRFTIDSALLYNATDKNFITYIFDNPIASYSTYHNCLYSYQFFEGSGHISSPKEYGYSKIFKPDILKPDKYYVPAFFGRALADVDQISTAPEITNPETATYISDHTGTSAMTVLLESSCWGRFCLFPNSQLKENSVGAFKLNSIPDFTSSTKYIASAKYVYNSSSETGAWTDIVSFTPDNPSVYPIFGDFSHIHIINRNTVLVTLTLTKSTGEKLLDELPLNAGSDTGTIKLEAGYTYTATFTFGKIKNKRDPAKLLTTSVTYYAGEDTSTNA